MFLEEKSVLCSISSLLDSVLFTYFQMVVAGSEVFQSKTKQIFMIFLKKNPTYCHFANHFVILKWKNHDFFLEIISNCQFTSLVSKNSMHISWIFHKKWTNCDAILLKKRTFENLWTLLEVLLNKVSQEFMFLAFHDFPAEPKIMNLRFNLHFIFSIKS